jgi:hypothetical protein
MIRIATAFLFLAGCVCVSARTEQTAGEFVYSFTAEIHGVAMATAADGKSRIGMYSYLPEELQKARKATLVVGFDASWQVQTTIKEADGDVPLFQKGAAVTFIIHSPTLSFGAAGEDMKGKTVRLDLYGASGKDGRVVFVTLQSHSEKEANQSSQSTTPSVTPTAGQEARQP